MRNFQKIEFSVKFTILILLRFTLGVKSVENWLFYLLKLKLLGLNPSKTDFSTKNRTIQSPDQLKISKKIELNAQNIPKMSNENFWRPQKGFVHMTTHAKTEKLFIPSHFSVTHWSQNHFKQQIFHKKFLFCFGNFAKGHLQKEKFANSIF